MHVSIRFPIVPAPLVLLVATALGGADPVGAQEIPPLPPPGLEQPHVVLVSTGGELSRTCRTRLEVDNCQSAAVSPEKWVESLPELRLLARLTIERLQPRHDTWEANEENWLPLASRLQELVDTAEVDGVVVAHDTSTLADAAYFINLVVRTQKPIVFVGALRPWTAMSGDGPLNLYNGVRVAASAKAQGMGVLQAINQEIFAARDGIKAGLHRVDAFESVDVGLVGVADPDMVKFFAAPTRRHTSASEFGLRSLTASLPTVGIVCAHPGALETVMEALIAAGAKGLILDCVETRGLSEGQLAAVSRAREQGVVVVAAAPTRGTRLQSTAHLRGLGIIPADNLVPGKARTLLRLALMKTSDPKGIERIFQEY